MSELAGELRYAIRSLMRSPGFTLVVVATLALGIGVNTAILSVVDAVLLEPLPYAEPERLVAIFESVPSQDAARRPTSPANFGDWREADVLESTTAARPWQPVLRGRGPAVQLSGLLASSTLFELLGVDAAIGRTFRADDDSGERTVVLGHELWRRQFGGDTAIVGRTVSLDGEPHLVLGVMPEGFAFPPFWAADAELWAPLVFAPEAAADREARYLRVFARLAPGVSPERAQATMTALAARLAERHPATNEGTTARVEPLLEPTVAPVRKALLVLLAAAGLVLLIACVNVANLVLVRAARRRRELALRAALGAGRARLTRQLVTESLLLAVAGGTAGLLLGGWCVDALLALAPRELPRLDGVALDGRALLAGFALALLTGVAFGLMPARRALRFDVASALEGARGASAARRGRSRGVLVVAQLALALVLLIGAGVLLQSLLRLWRLDPGFEPGGRLAVSLSLAGSEHLAAERQLPFFDAVLSATRELPGVEAAALVNHLPIGGDVWSLGFTVEGAAPVAAMELQPKASFRVITPEYFATMGIPLLAGRPFGADDRADTTPVAIVSRALAERHWPGESAVGRRLRLGGSEEEENLLAVVGVVGDVRHGALDADLRPEIYFPYAQNPVSFFPETTLVLHAAAPAAVRRAVVERIARLEPDVPVTAARPLAEYLGDSLVERRFYAVLLAFFAVLALVLATVGIYGVMSSAVEERRPELGIRVALGARRSQILALVVGGALRLVLLGLALGLAGSFVALRFLRSLLFETRPLEPTAVVVVAAVLALAALAAAYLPARRATRVDPLLSLRAE